MGSKRSSGRLLWLVFLSGGGLLVVGLIGLWRSVRDAELRARVEHRQAAEREAGGLRALLTRPVLLERASPPQRFALAAGALVVPEDLGWFEAPPPPGSPPLAVIAALRDAARLEFGAGDPVAAAAALRAALTRAPDEQRAALLAAAGWNAHRRADAPARDAALDQLLALPHPNDVAADTLLLAAAAGRSLPDWAAAWCTCADPDQARAVCDRLREQGAETGELRASLETAEQRRVALSAAATVTPKLAAATDAVLVGAGPRLIAFFPQAPGTGQGVVLDAAGFAGLGVASRFAARWSETPPAADAVAVAGPLALALEASPTDAWSRPWLLSALLLALAACFGGGLHLALRSLRREAAAQRTRAEFLTTVTHELKTPLASLRLLAEMLEQERVPAERRPEYHALLAGESVRLGALIENVLDLGRLERGERSYDRRAQAPAEVVRGAVELFGPLAQRDGLRVEAAIDDDGARATFDRGALEQALLNVMDNARKYARDGGRLQVVAARQNGAYHVRVRDHGPGVDASEREAIFERFVRGARHADGSVPGVGLGMHLSRRILRDHGGDLVCEAPVDGGPGACFHLHLPLTENEA